MPKIRPLTSEGREAALTAYRWGHDNGKRTYAAAVFEAAEKWRSA